MTHSRPRIKDARKPTEIPSTCVKVSGPAVPVPVPLPKPAGVRKPIPRAKPIAKMNKTARSTTHDYALQATVALKDEAMEESEGYLRPTRRRVTKAKTTVTRPSKSEFYNGSDSPIRRRASKAKASVSHPTLKASALPAPAAPANTASELENLMTIGCKQVENKVKDRIKEEKEKNSLLKKQTATFENYQEFLSKLKDLEDELRELKEENRLNEITLLDIAEDFRESTMKWAALFEKYAKELGISVFDTRRWLMRGDDGKGL